MSFPTVAFSDPVAAQSALMNKASENGLSAAVLDGVEAVQNAVLANLFTELPPNVIGSVTPVTQAITEAGAISLDAGYVAITGPESSTYAVTLAAPTATQRGRVMVIEMIATTSTNAVTLALTNVVGGSESSSASFNAAGEQLVLVAAGSKWVVIKENGVTLS